MLTTIGLALVLLGAVAEERLPGSELSIDEAVGRSQIIVVTAVDHPGEARPGPPGASRRVGVRLKPTRGLKGGTGTRELTLEVLDVKNSEAPPERGSDYIVFVERPGFERGNATRYRGIKVLRATEANLAAVSEAQRREVRWPGSWRNIHDAARDAHLVVVAKFTERGEGRMGPPASTSYGPVKIEVARTLKGKAKAGLAPTFHVVTFPPEHAERVPVPGDEYVMFIELRDGVTPHILRMMPATEENLRAAREAFQRLRPPRQGRVASVTRGPA